MSYFWHLNKPLGSYDISVTNDIAYEFHTLFKMVKNPSLGQIQILNIVTAQQQPQLQQPNNQNWVETT